MEGKQKNFFLEILFEPISEKSVFVLAVIAVIAYLVIFIALIPLADGRNLQRVICFWSLSGTIVFEIDGKRIESGKKTVSRLIDEAIPYFMFFLLAVSLSFLANKVLNEYIPLWLPDMVTAICLLYYLVEKAIKRLQEHDSENRDTEKNRKAFIGEILRRIKSLLGKMKKGILKMTNVVRYGKLMPMSMEKKYYKEFMSENEAYDWGKEHYGEWTERYRETMANAEGVVFQNDMFYGPLEYYCGENYAEINEFLRTGEIAPKLSIDYEINSENRKSASDIRGEQRSRYSAIIDLLKLVLCSAPRIPENIVVYRLVNNKVIREIIRENKHGQAEYLERGFLSTSLVKSALSGDINCSNYTTEENLLKIYVPEGIIGVYVNEAVERSEGEVLFLPGMNLRLIGYPWKDRETEKTVYECELSLPLDK